MRIWIINHYALPPTSAGGTRHYNFAKQLIEKGHEVTIIASNFNHFSQSYITTNAKVGEIDHTYEVPFMWIPSPSYRGNTISRFWNMLVFSYRLHQKKYLSNLPMPDVIIGSSPHLFAALSAELLSRRYNIPFLMEIRDIWPDTLVELGRFSARHPIIKLMKWIERYLYKHADRIICLLPMAENYLRQLGVSPENILTLPNAIDSQNIPSDIVHDIQEKFTFMYAGAHGLANDLHTVLQAAKILQNQGLAEHIKICLIGDGPEKANLKKLAAQEQITIVEFIDAMPKNKIYATLNKADAYIMLLKDSPVFRWGISPNKLFDYLVMARPVIFGVETPFNPVKENNAGISIKPSNPEALAAAMYELSITSKDSLKAMGIRGREFVLNKHNVPYLTDILENCIEEVVTT